MRSRSAKRQLIDGFRIAAPLLVWAACGGTTVDVGHTGKPASTTDGGMTLGAGGVGTISVTAGHGGAGNDGGCPSDFRSFLPPKMVVCPTALPTDVRAPCDIAENANCVWQFTWGFVACGCYQVLEGKEWACAGAQGPSICPLSPPADGSSCSVTGTCSFPFLSCVCTPHGWSCTPNDFFVVREVERACPPAGVDESKLVKDLTDAEARAWCEWYGDPSGNPRPPISPNQPPDAGATSDYGYTWLSDLSGGGLSVCFSELPVEDCLKNLRLKPCDATLEELDDCLETMRAAPQGGRVGHGCAPYRKHPSCDRIIVQGEDILNAGGGCEVPLK